MSSAIFYLNAQALGLWQMSVFFIPVVPVLVESVFLGENIWSEKIFEGVFIITSVILSQRFKSRLRRGQKKKEVE